MLPRLKCALANDGSCVVAARYSGSAARVSFHCDRRQWQTVMLCYRVIDSVTAADEGRARD